VYNRAALARAIPEQNHKYGLKKDFEIEPQRPVVDILQVHLHPFLKLHPVAAAHLPDTCQTRLQTEASALPHLIQLHFDRQRGPGTNDTHIPFEDVDQLRDFIDAEFAENTPDFRDPRIVFHLEHRAVHLVHFLQFPPFHLRPDVHRAELVQRESSAVEP